MGRHPKDQIYAARIEFKEIEEGKKTKKIVRVSIHCSKRDNPVKIDLEFPTGYLEEKDVSWVGYYRRQRRGIYSGPNNQVDNQVLPMHPLGQKLESLVSEAFSKI